MISSLSSTFVLVGLALVLELSFLALDFIFFQGPDWCRILIGFLFCLLLPLFTSFVKLSGLILYFSGIFMAFSGFTKIVLKWNKFVFTSFLHHLDLKLPYFRWLCRRWSRSIHEQISQIYVEIVLLVLLYNLIHLVVVHHCELGRGNVQDWCRLDISAMLLCRSDI